MEFRVLGQLEVVARDGSWSAAIGGSKQRAVLAMLLLHAGRPVPVSRLVEAVWQEPPDTAAHAVEVYISRLRKALAAGGDGRERIARRNGGYVALVEPDELDLLRFRSLVEQAEEAVEASDPATSARLLTAALGLWRGEPLACIQGSPLHQLASLALQDERFAAVDAWIETELELEHHAKVASALRRLLAEHPDRESLWCTLMLTLYRSGRQNEALEAYALARTSLKTRYGLEPGRELRDMQRRILEQDDTLEPRRGRNIERAAIAALPRGGALLVTGSIVLAELQELSVPALALAGLSA